MLKCDIYKKKYYIFQSLFAYIYENCKNNYCNDKCKSRIIEGKTENGIIVGCREGFQIPHNILLLKIIWDKCGKIIKNL